MAASDPEVLSGPDSGAPPPVADSGAKPGGEEKKTETKSEAKPDAKAEAKAARDYEAEIARLKAENAEKDQVAIYWHKQAQKSQPDDDDDPPAKGAKTAKKDEPDEDDDPDKFVNKLTTQGAGAIVELLNKRGFMSAKQVQELVDSRVSAVTRTEQLYAEYPDLRNESSELFKETQKEFGDIIALDKSLKNSPATIKLAVKSAAARLKAAKEIEEARKPKETAAERNARIAAQQGDPGRRGGAEFEDEAPGQLTDLQKHMLERFNAAGGGPDIDPEKLMKRMKAGVRMQYVPGRDSQGRFQ